MSRATERLDACEGAAAYRVASLLQRPRTVEVAGAESLRGTTAQIEQFLAMASREPAVRIEPECMQSGSGDSSGAEELALADEGPTLQLSVVAGVLEEVDVAAEQRGISSVDGLVLPTAANQQELQRRKAEQAQAMLDLLSALSPSAPAPCGRRGASHTAAHVPSSDDSDDGVVVMDASDLMGEDSNEDDAPATPRRIVEMD
ncbi:conserved hypothetical protein [Leishmania mexicana MHOM/GT/2001/U1103]|uniref:Uncharacterized protein n=1 Tax=Leishmania mexicana (strain MHOM/GT/2001/U1103) TaxID=929439 RepID=E9B6P3_LEIMU|nr:conserved hypothetical protein [Leishmania mexicana MHOM/GT/2001/U1103]CBZ30915.1 conserved hypothetical protein [Leishmania mexicana MHOM/GT/2001/U1103]